ncbi:MAG: hypothetical protein ACI97N_000887 [Cognaticolwellia sp.]
MTKNEFQLVSKNDLNWIRLSFRDIDEIRCSVS